MGILEFTSFTYIYLEVELLDHMVNPMFIFFYRNHHTIYHNSYTILHSAKAEVFLFLYILANTYYFLVWLFFFFLVGGADNDHWSGWGELDLTEGYTVF